MVDFVSVSNILNLVRDIGPEPFLKGLAGAMEDSYRRWQSFEKVARIGSHTRDGVIELMPTSDGQTYGFKCVNCHPVNTASGLQTVVAFGVLSDVATGYPVLVSEMTVLTALRTAAMSAMAARHLARPDSTTMAIIGSGAQCEFQALAFRAVLGINRLRLYDIDARATEKARANLVPLGFEVTTAPSAEAAVAGADIVTTVTADKQFATILSDNMIGAGVHLNAVGGDCPGKTELAPPLLHRANIFVEYPEQTRVEGEIQQLAPDHPVTELWQVITGAAAGRRGPQDVTLFDSVGFAVEDFTALTYLHDLARGTGYAEDIELLPDPADPRDLFGLLGKARPDRNPRAA
ncbi:ornithine cyclodeaminase [Oceanibium sediminis]|uniref:ornithine cyclodeaminase n=1 Tax=Oceanibium sediminis TaxID=2026339 RepID=UPI000DD2B689|nr:ornithine cyclodeaminase [Oceanibium sediminis]